jgi:hypothetical protein
MLHQLFGPLANIDRENHCPKRPSGHSPRGVWSRQVEALIAQICLLVLCAGACGRQPLGVGSTGGSEAGTSGSVGSPGGGAGLDANDGGPSRPLGHLVCAGVTCFQNQICCIANGKCVDQDTANVACPRPDASTEAPGQPGASGGSRSCASSADCEQDEFCEPTNGCLGPATCASKTSCGTSSGAQGFCGCDGMTYPTVQAACHAGVSLVSGDPIACGVPMNQMVPGAAAPRDPMIYCGLDSQCPKGDRCCAITGRCYDVQIPYLCSTPPPGTRAPCLEDKQCGPFEFCLGEGCAGPGGCVPKSGNGECGNGLLAPVCGCDGVSYTNDGCTRSLGIRVSHTGACGEDGGAG